MWIFFEIDESGQYDECVSSGIISWKCLFRPHYEVFLAKKQKTSNIGKSRKYEKFFSRKKRFHLLKLHLHQIGKAQNMAVLAGRLVDFHFKVFFKKKIITSFNDFKQKLSILKARVDNNANLTTKKHFVTWFWPHAVLFWENSPGQLASSSSRYFPQLVELNHQLSDTWDRDRNLSTILGPLSVPPGSELKSGLLFYTSIISTNGYKQMFNAIIFHSLHTLNRTLPLKRPRHTGKGWDCGAHGPCSSLVSSTFFDQIYKLITCQWIG